MDTETPILHDLSTRFRRSAGRDGRTKAVSVKLTQAELSEVDRRSMKEQKAIGEWAREVLLREARRSDRDPLFTEIVATRMLLNLALKPLVCREVINAAEFNAMLTEVRTTKHEAAADVMQQYALAEQKER